MTPERFSGSAPLLVGVMPEQHPEVLQTAASLAAKLSVPLVCAFVDEASYLVEWDPARSAHRLSLHPEQEAQDIRAVTTELNSVIEHTLSGAAAGGAAVEWTLRTLTGDPARALARLAAESNVPIIIVGTSKRGFSHRIAEALHGSVGHWLAHHQSRPVLVVPSWQQAQEDCHDAGAAP